MCVCVQGIYLVRTTYVDLPSFQCIGMDIADIELVVVNGPPATLSQLHQVYNLV